MAFATGIRQADHQSIAPKLDIPSHPLANSKLGAFLYHSVYNNADEGAPAEWETAFYYEHGNVCMWVESGRYCY